MYEVYKKNKLIARALQSHDVEEIIEEEFNLDRLPQLYTHWLETRWEEFEVKEIPG